MVDPLVYLFDAPVAAVVPLSELGLTKLRASNGLEEDDCGHHFTACPVLMNDKLVAVFDKDSPEVQVYSRQSSGVKSCATLQPICDGASKFQRTGFTIHQNSRSAVGDRRRNSYATEEDKADHL